MAWLGLVVFSAVTLGAFEADQDANDRNAKEKWVLSALSISLALSFLGVLAHYIVGEKFVGKPAGEGLLSTLLLAVWAGALPVIMKPSNDLAVEGGSFGVQNANLYFFSWAALACALWMFVGYAQEVAGRDVVTEIEPKVAKWCALCVSQGIAVRDLRDICQLASLISQ
jgi:hypothetical protein